MSKQKKQIQIFLFFLIGLFTINSIAFLPINNHDSYSNSKFNEIEQDSVSDDNVIPIILKSSSPTMWTDNGVMVGTTTSADNDHDVCVDGAGGWFFGWVRGSDGIWGSRYDADGAKVGGQWSIGDGSDPQRKLAMAAGSSTMLMAWFDDRGSGYKVYTKRISQSGSNSYGDAVQGYMQLYSSSTLDYYPDIIHNGVNGHSIVTIRYENNIMVSRMTGTSNDAETTLCSASGLQHKPKLCTDGSGGAIVTWEDYRSGSNYDIYAGRVTSSGGVPWTSNGEKICTSSNDQLYPRICSDGNDGAFIAWEDNNGDGGIYAQYINSTGNTQWTDNGTLVCNLANQQRAPRVCSDGNRNAYIAWVDNRSTGDNYDIYIQKLNSTGDPQWTTNGLPVCTYTGHQGYYSSNFYFDICSTNEGVVVVWSDSRAGNNDIYGQLIVEGTNTWDANGTVICDATGDQNDPKIKYDGVASACVVWGDNRGANRDIYAQALDVASPPTWDESPTNHTIEFGDSFSYDVNASDTSGIDHYWVNDTVNFTVDINGEITNATYLAVGVYSLEIRACDPYNNNCSAIINITVEDTIAPTWNEVPADQTIEFGASLNYDVNASDLSGIGLYWVNDTGNFSVNGDGVITNATSLSAGVYWLEIRACDPYNNNESAIINTTILPSTPPTWDEAPTDQIIEFGDSFSYDVNASDFSGIDYYWVNDTVNFTVDINGLITNISTLIVRVYWVEIRAYDPYNNNKSEIINITVEDTTPATWDEDPTDQTIEFKDSFSYDVNASDLSGIGLYWVNDTGNFSVNGDGVITNATSLSAGVYWLEIRACDPYNNNDSAIINITVLDPTTPIWDEDPADQTVEFGDSFSYDVNASDFSGIDYYWLNDTINFTVDINGLITNISTLIVKVYWIEIRAYDPFNNNCSAVINITVEDTTPATWIEDPEGQTIEFGDSFSYDVNASDLSGIDHYWINDTVNFTVDINGLITNVSSLIVRIYWIEIRGCDPYNNNCSAIINITVEDTTLATWIEDPEGQIIEFGDSFSYDVNASDLSSIDQYWINDTVNFTVDINGVITNISSLIVKVYWIEIRGCDPYNNNCSAVINITVEDTINATWDEVPLYQIIEFGASFSYDVNASDLSGIDHYWINNTGDFQIDGNGMMRNTTSLVVGEYSIEIRGCDPYNNNCSILINITVEAQAAPKWDVIPTDQMIKYGVAFSYAIYASDLSRIDHYWINDTENFYIDDNGIITNKRLLQVGIYWLEIRVFDPFNNNCSIIIKISVESEGNGGDGSSDIGEDDFFLIIIIIIIGSVLSVSVGGLFIVKKRGAQQTLEKQDLSIRATKKRKALIAKGGKPAAPQGPVVPKKVEKGKKEASKTDIGKPLTATEIAELKKTEEEVGVMEKEIICVVHKGPVIGASYICPKCKTNYCMKCAKAIKEKGENCWSCEREIEL